jgi:WD40 repeat protein
MSRPRLASARSRNSQGNRQRRNEAYFYDIMSEFLVPWIQRQRVLSDARVALRKWRRRVGIGLAVAGAIVGTLGVVAILIYRERERDEDERALAKLEAEEAQSSQLRQFLKNADHYHEQHSQGGVDTQQRAIDSVISKEDISPETPVTSTAGGDDAGQPADADLSGAVDYNTDKIFVGHKGAVWNVHYSTPPIGGVFPGKSDSYCITAGRDQTARVWDWKGDNDFVLEGHRGEVNDARFNPQPRSQESWFAATASDDRTVGLWKPKEPDKPVLLKGHRGAVTALAWSSDGSWLASTSRDNDVRIWNVAGDAPPKSKVLAGHTDKVWLPCLVESEGKGWLATPSADGTARLWNFPGGEPVSFGDKAASDQGVLRHGAPVRRVAMDSKARWVLTAGADGRAKLWERATGKQLLSIRHENDVMDVAFEPNGARFVTASADNTAQVWDAQSQQGIVTLRGHTAPIFSARFTEHGPGVVTVSWDKTARLWNYETKKCIAVLRGHTDVLWSVEFSPMGHAFMSTSGDGTARLWPLNRIPGGVVFMPVRAGAK